MKSIFTLGITIALFIFIGCSQQKTEELHGTWINMEYKESFDPEDNLKQKIVFYPNGIFESFLRTDKPKADYKAVYKIEERWTDKDGNIWYKYRLTEKGSVIPDSFYLSKISSSGKEQEYQFEFESYAEKIDPSRLSYRKYYRE